ncbi:hypothetical protein H9660_10875 [Clostridium sp. Sa3CUN1]|uniref:UDP-2,4-diacetamido-2,4, 6-trideoxy-beta-L-altropyranose hydrolase n=1 Tax=Clostridium gallinarum TaxID=2762246 RepID=A0ABR8Q5E3_9CLOT|nr:hypothetical protein [Clostridium gallinarum]MBD7915647.1 hypothetical protein [Clostridium gallinarum]
MNNKIVFLVNGSKDIGMGHISRCMPIAKELEKYIDIEFWSIINEELRKYYLENSISFKFFNSKKELLENMKYINFKYIFTDSYDLIESDYEYIKSLNKNLFSIIDFKGNYKYCDILISPNLCFTEDDFICDADCIKLVGNKYILLKNNVINVKNKFLSNNNYITVTLGGSDIYSKTELILDYIYEWIIRNNYKVNVIIGPYFKQINSIKMKCCEYGYKYIENCYDIAPIISESKIAIISGGVTLHECLYLNTVPVVYVQADNQIEEVKFLRNKNRIIYAGMINEKLEFNEFNLVKKLDDAKGFTVEEGYIDEYGKKRIVREILKFINDRDEVY